MSKHISLLSLFLLWTVPTCLQATALTEQIANNRVSLSNCMIDADVRQAKVLQQALPVNQSGVLHLFTHGQPGALWIEGRWQTPPAIADWLIKTKDGEAITQLNIYGCSFAKGGKGRAAVAYLERTLGICVAASNDLTGVDGDWDLEVGTAQEPFVFAPKYAFNLQCPDAIRAYDLRGIEPFAQTNNLVLCGEPDTLAFLFFSRAEEVIIGANMEVQLPPGMEYAGFVEGFYAWNEVLEANVLDSSNPRFFLPKLEPELVYVIYIGVQGTCDLNINEEDAKVNMVLRYPYRNLNTGQPISCEEAFTPLAEFNSEFKVPVLNVLSVFDETETDASIELTDASTPACHTIKISQDGIKAYVHDFVFTVDNLDADALIVNSMNVNGMPFTDYTQDVATHQLMATIDGTYFTANFDPSNLPTDTLFNENEQVSVEICYTTINCDADPITFLTYGVTYGCYDKLCSEPSIKQGSVEYKPDFGATPNALNTSLDQAGVFCGDELIWSTDLSSINAQPLEGLWQDLILKWDACENSNYQIADVQIGGQSVFDLVIVNNSVVVDFTANTNPIPGLTDEDGDGFIDDLAGGNTLALTVVTDVVCATDATCAGAQCLVEQVDILGQRNCGDDFQDFADLVPDITYGYGETTFATNDVLTYAGISVTENFILDAACANWEPTNNGFALDYTFDKTNVSACSNSTLYMEVTVSGSQIEYIRPVANSATYMGNAVAITNITYDDPTDPTTLTFTIPAGDIANDNATHQYYFNWEVQDTCTPPKYYSTSMRVIEECPDCAEADPCKIYRSCHSVLTRVDYNGAECTCVCPVYTWTEVERCNFGYTDKSMTTKVDPATLDSADLKRFLPGDTALMKVYYRIDDLGALLTADRFWSFYWTIKGMQAPLIADPMNTYLKGIYIKDGTTGVTQQIKDFPGFVNSNDNEFSGWGGIRVYNTSRHGWTSTCHDPVKESYCDTDRNLNPDYDPATGPFNYRVTDRRDDFASQGIVRILWGLPESCPVANTCGTTTNASDVDYWNVDKNNSMSDFITMYDVEVGDVFVLEVKVPLMHNPGYDLSLLNGVPGHEEITTIGDFNGYTTERAICTQASAIGSCDEEGAIEGRIPTMSVETDIIVDDCDVEVKYTFKAGGLIPAIPDTVPEWYPNEYRPALYAEYIQPNFPRNLVYLGEATITDGLGNQTALDDSYVDVNYGNLSCVPDGNGGQCCGAVDTTRLAGLRWVDDQFYESLSITANTSSNPGGFYSNREVPRAKNLCSQGFPLIHKPNDPFPALSVGGSNDCQWQLTYKLKSLCPEDLASNMFTLDAQFAERYVPNMNIQNPYVWEGGDPSDDGACTFANYNYGYYWPTINPYGAIPWNTLDAACPATIYDNPFALVHPNAIYSPEATNPARKTYIDFPSSADNFVDNSATFPPLIPNISNSLIADLANENEVVTYQVCAGNAGAATHENVATTISVPVTIDLIDVLDTGGASLPYTLLSNEDGIRVYYLSIPDLAPTDCYDIQIVTELLFCPIGTDLATEICAKTTSGCLDAQKAAQLATSGLCNDAYICYQYIKEEAELQAEWITPTIADFGLCDTIDFEVRIKNVKPAILVSLDPTWYLPEGLEVIAGSWATAYPGGPTNLGTWVGIPDPTFEGVNAYGATYSYDATNDFEPAFVGPNGLPGITGDAATTDSNKVSIRFRAVTACNEFVSGTVPRLRVTAGDPCETTIGTPIVESLPIIIDEADPKDYAKMLTFAEGAEINCGSTATITISSLNISPFEATTEASRMCITFPPSDINYVANSIAYVTPAGFDPNASESINADTMKVCFDVPDGVGPGEQYTIGLDVELYPEVECGIQQVGVEIKSFLENKLCTSTNETCGVYVLNSVNPLIDVEFAPPLNVPKVDVSVLCSNDPDSTDIAYAFELINPATGSAYNDALTITAIQDINNNGIIDAFDPIVATGTQNINLNAGESMQVEGQLTIAAELACPILFDIQQNTACTCDHITFAVDKIKPDFLAQLGDKQVLCPNDELVINICGKYIYFLNIREGGTLNIDTTAGTAAISLATGYGIDEPVVLNVLGIVGDCPAIHELNLYQLADFELVPFSTEMCATDCRTLDLDLPTEIRDIATVSWSPTDFLSDSTSHRPEVCQPTNDMTYTATVTLNTGEVGCMTQADYPLIVSQPTIEDVLTGGSICASEDVVLLEAPIGFDTYAWYQQVGDANFLLQSGTDHTLIVTEFGTYWVEYYNDNDALCKTQSELVEVNAADCCTRIKCIPIQIRKSTP